MVSLCKRLLPPHNWILHTFPHSDSIPSDLSLQPYLVNNSNTQIFHHTAQYNQILSQISNMWSEHEQVVQINVLSLCRGHVL